MLRVTKRTSGFREIDQALAQLPKSTAAALLRADIRERLEPIAADYRDHVAVEKGDLRDGIGVGFRLTRRQARLQRRAGKSFVEGYAGASADPAAHLEEFGSIHNAPNRALTAAWDKYGGEKLIDGMSESLWARIRKAADRLARRTARLAQRR
jgi:hypothetical protein